MKRTMKSNSNRTGFVGIDVDSLHHYYPWSGAGSTPSRNVVWECAIPRFLDLLAECGLRATFFVVGQDAAHPSTRRWLRRIVDCGHEVASHSHTHPQNLALLARSDKEREIVHAERALCQATGEPVMGFRAPAWGVDEEILSILASRGYAYDSSIMPCVWLPLLQLAYFLKSRGQVRPRDLLGPWRNGAAPVSPYAPQPARMHRRGEGAVIELPVAVVPYLRFPFWATVHLAAGSWPCFAGGYRLVRKGLASLHYQCHAVDLLDIERDGAPCAFSRMFGLSRPVRLRRDLLKRILQTMKRDYRLLPGLEVARLWRRQQCAQATGWSKAEPASF